MTRSVSGPPEAGGQGTRRSPLIRDSQPAAEAAPAVAVDGSAPSRQAVQRPAGTLPAFDTEPAVTPAVDDGAARAAGALAWLGRGGPRWLAAALVSGALLLATVLLADLVGLLQTLASWHWLLALPLALLLAAFLAFAAVAGWRELAGLRRLRKLARLRATGEALAASGAVATGRGELNAYLDAVARLYSGREPPAVGEALARFRQQREAHHSHAEQIAALSSALTPLDREALRIISGQVRVLGAISALNPVPLVDGVLLLWLSLRMIRRVALVYGGRPGLAGSWRLAREVLLLIAATGAADLAVDSAGDALGAGVAGLASAKLGQGILTGLLVARVGLYALRACRPVPLLDRQQSLWRELRRSVFDLSAAGKTR